MVTKIDAQERTSNLVGLLLAAGVGKRFGSNKLQNAKLDGVPIGVITANKFRQVAPLYVVVRAGDDEGRSLFQNAGFNVVISEFASQGMGHSLGAGLAQLRAVGATACLVGLADMPLIKTETLNLLCKHLRRGADIVRPRYLGRAGQPVGFDQAHFAKLSQLGEDRGARDYLREHENFIDYLDVDDAGTVIDVDTPADLAKVSV